MINTTQDDTRQDGNNPNQRWKNDDSFTTTNSDTCSWFSMIFSHFTNIFFSPPKIMLIGTNRYLLSVSLHIGTTEDHWNCVIILTNTGATMNTGNL